MQVESVRPSQLIRRQDPSAHKIPDVAAGTSRRHLLQTPNVQPPANFTIYRGDLQAAAIPEQSDFECLCHLCTSRLLEVLQLRRKQGAVDRTTVVLARQPSNARGRIGTSAILWREGQQQKDSVLPSTRCNECRCPELPLLLYTGITTRALEVNRKLRLTGKGVRVAVIDSGEHCRSDTCVLRECFGLTAWSCARQSVLCGACQVTQRSAPLLWQ